MMFFIQNSYITLIKIKSFISKIKKNNELYGFTMLEILLALVFVSFALLPIYNLFSFSYKGVVSNQMEIEATNYASDIINLLKDVKYSFLESKLGVNNQMLELKTEDEINNLFQNLKIGTLPPINPSYKRTIKFRKFEGRNTAGPMGIIGRISDFILDRRAIKNYLVEVKVSYEIPNTKKEDNVVLYAIIVD